MTISEWQSLGPAAAAREVHRRAAALPPAQQRAVLASLMQEADLAAALAQSTGPLAGVPYLLKDLFDLAGQPTFAGSTFLPEVRPAAARDSVLVQALRAAGATCAGKTHLHEFAYGITGENPHYGDCEHPHFPGRTTGGSSSGSAAAVAAGLAPFAIGTDTGGSVRVPAAFCGLYGLRLTPCDRFIADAFPLAQSFDTAGWFTAHAADLRRVTEALCGADPLLREPRGCWLGWPGLDAEVAAAFRPAAEKLCAPANAPLTATLNAAFATAPAIYGDIVAAEAWATHRPWAEAQRSRYDPAVWPRLSRGAMLDSAAVAHARAGHERVKAVWAAFFADHDFLVLPATPCAALTKADCTAANRARLLALTTPASLAGRPVLTVPVPLPSGLTTGLQIVVRDARSPVISWALDRFSA
ncbi:MAG: amidase [Verrucomicrobia bacterium]|nr:amidase [Verrucomicrobiota bacterium]